MQAMIPRLALVVLLFSLLGGCATGPRILTDADPAVDVGAYGSFGFFEPLATDTAGYSTLLTARLKAATRRQLETRGYVYDEVNPNLLVNFNVNIVEKTEIRSSPSVTAGFGYYGYRHGMYGAWSGYPYDIESTNYRQGTLVIDVVDATRRTLVWQGVAEGRVTRKMSDNPASAVDAAVGQILASFPMHMAREPAPE
ncbi:MAG: DUF4136 domain-containing protein [Gammaproteobacteria bacterium]|nr:DUF4136 domain-containing protein [Gammaproteobacteria bacterium]